MLILSGYAFAASSVTTTPVSFDDHSGTWLQVQANVESGTTITVKVIADYNGNGVQEADEPVVRYNIVTDGVAPIVASSPAPGDEDGENGHLSTRLDFWRTANFAGNYIVIVDDGNGAASAQFTITQSSTGQSVAGVLRDNISDPLAGFVVAQDDSHNMWITMTDANGAYTLHLPEGEFVVFGLSLGYLSKFSGGSGAEVSLGSGEHKTNVDLMVYPGDYTISGSITQSPSDSSVPWLWLWAESEDEFTGKMSFAMTDGKGAFSIPVENGEWEIFPEDPQCNYRGLVNRSVDVIVNGANITDQNISLPEATTYITGTVSQKSDGTPLSGVMLFAENQQEDMEQFGYTHDNGVYVLFVTPGEWNVNIEECEVVRLGYVYPSPKTVLPTQGVPSTSVDFELVKPTAYITVQVKEAGTLNPVRDMDVWLDDSEWNFMGSLETNDMGECMFGVIAGSYFVGIEDNDLAEQGYIFEPYQNISIQNGESKTLTFDLQKGNATLQGALTNEGNPVSFINVMLLDDAKNWLGSQGTDQNGEFSFPVLAGSYYLQPDGNQLLERNLMPVEAHQASVSSGETKTVDFVIPTPDSTINVIINGEGTPLENVRVHLNNQSGTWLGTRQTDSSGSVALKVIAGTYEIGFMHDDALALDMLPKPNRVVDISSGQTQDVVFSLRPRDHQTAVDAILGRIALETVEEFHLDMNGNFKIEIGDVIVLINDAP